MSTDGTLGEIRVFAGFVPKYWAPCDGRLMNISENTALFSLLGTRFGGDGTRTFGVPDLRGAVAIGTGAGTSGPAVNLAGKVGTSSVTLTSDQVPPHSHALTRKGSTDASQKTNAVGTNSNLAQVSHLYGSGSHELVPHLLQNASPNTTLDPASISSVPGNQPHENMQPYQVLNFGICLNGIFPQRS
jgi:microcystin-dependent protein